MSKARSVTKFALALVAASLLAPLASMQPASAQYYPWWYFGQSLLYPLTRGLTGSLLYGPYNANPLYSGSFFLKRAASNAVQWPYIYGYNPTAYGPYGYRNLGNPPNYNYGLNSQDLNPPQDDSLYTQGGQQNLPQAYQQPLHLPNGYVQPQTLPQGKSGSQPVPIFDPGPNDAGLLASPSGIAATQAGMPVGTPLGNPGASTASAVPAGAPLAPQVLKGKKKSRHKHENAATGGGVTLSGATQSLPQPAASTTVGSTSPIGSSSTPSAQFAQPSNPLAQGFIDHVVSRYDGNIAKALGSQDTRSWARAMGLVDEASDVSSLPADRLEVINKVLRDNSLDAVSKIDTLRILMRKKSP